MWPLWESPTCWYQATLHSRWNLLNEYMTSAEVATIKPILPLTSSTYPIRSPPLSCSPSQVDASSFSAWQRALQRRHWEPKVWHARSRCRLGMAICRTMERSLCSCCATIPRSALSSHGGSVNWLERTYDCISCSHCGSGTHFASGADRPCQECRQ